MTAPKAPAPTDAQIDSAMMRLARARGPSKTICPSEVARDLGGDDEDIWRPLMDPVRRRAVAAAKAGTIVIKQAGKVADPEAFTGIYRIAILRR